jgi:hypothetical protein
MDFLKKNYVVLLVAFNILSTILFFLYFNNKQETLSKKYTCMPIGQLEKVCNE